MANFSRRHSQRQTPGPLARVFWIVFAGLVAALVISLFGPSSRRVISPPPPDPMASMSARTLQSHASANGIVGGALAGQKALAASHSHDAEHVNHIAEAPRTPSGPRPAIEIRQVRSETPQTTREKAIVSALGVAHKQLVERLHALQPPITEVPPPEVVARDYFKPESVVEEWPDEATKKEWETKGIEPNRLSVKLDLEVSDSQLRELRKTDRVSVAGMVLAAVFVSFGGLFGFLRLDLWTKGYLTAGLGISSIVIVMLAVLALAAILG